MYEINISVIWEKIYRFSPESNFIMIVGLAVLPQGTVLKEGAEETTDELRLSISFTLPWAALDDDTTPYQIVDLIRGMAAAREVMGAEAFVMGLKDKDTTMETLRKYIPSDVTSPEAMKEPPQKETLVEFDKYPHFLSSFDMDKLNEEQQAAYKLTMSWGLKK